MQTKTNNHGVDDQNDDDECYREERWYEKHKK